MLKSAHTDGTLVFDMSDRITTHDEAYTVTASKNVGPVARAVVQLMPAQGKAEGPVCFGQEIRIVANPYICNKALYLHSCPVTPMVFARFSRNQEVCLHVKPTYNTVWKIVPGEGAAKLRNGQPVMANERILFAHQATHQYLSNDNICYRNDFGNETEVSSWSAATKSKTQMLAGEYNGEKVREDNAKAVAPTNYWTIELASEPSASEPIAEAPRYDGA